MYTDSAINKLIIGTAQFGLKYGINNPVGKPNQKAVGEMLRFCYQIGINTIDTADAYGNASDLIGRFHSLNIKKFNVITKFKDGGEEFNVKSWLDFTLKKLKTPSLFACMFHSINDYLNNPKLLKDLSYFYDIGLIKNIGVSIYSNEHFARVIDDPSVHLIQLPYNLLDNKSQRGALIQKAKDKNKIIHVRSVFLQGLFFMDLGKLPIKLKPLKSELDYLQQMTKEHNIPMQTLALKYVASNPNVDSILIGVDNINQLKANINSINVEIPQTLIHQIDNISTQYLELLNPVNWA